MYYQFYRKLLVFLDFSWGGAVLEPRSMGAPFTDTSKLANLGVYQHIYRYYVYKLCIQSHSKAQLTYYPIF